MQTFVYKTSPGNMGEIYAELMEYDKERNLVVLKINTLPVAFICLSPGQFVAEKSIWGPQIHEIKQEQPHAS